VRSLVLGATVIKSTPKMLQNDDTYHMSEFRHNVASGLRVLVDVLLITSFDQIFGQTFDIGKTL